MQYFKSARFLALLFLSFTLVIGCIAMITVTKASSQWRLFQEETLSAGTFNEDMQSSATNAHWIIRAHEDRIGVFKLNGELEYVIDVYLITLPAADQTILTDGIYISGEKQLAAFMEDYTG